MLQSGRRALTLDSKTSLTGQRQEWRRLRRQKNVSRTRGAREKRGTSCTDGVSDSFSCPLHDLLWAMPMCHRAVNLGVSCGL